MKTVFLLAIISTTMEMVVCLICARQLGRLRHETGDNSRWLLALGSLASGLMAGFALVANIAAGTGAAKPLTMLPPWMGLIYMSLHIIMVLYPITVVRSDWLTPLRYFFLFLPPAVFTFAFLFFIGRWTQLDTTADIIANVKKADVLLRLASQAIMIPYCFILFILPYSYRKSSANFWWIVNYSFGLTVICVVHIILVLTNIPYLMVLLPLLAALFYYLSMDFELGDRLRPGKTTEKIPEVPEVTPQKVEEKPVQSHSPEVDLWSRITNFMDKEEIWRDPDLSLVSMARRCGTNVTYLNRIIRHETNSGFKEMIISRRVASVADQLRNDPECDIQEAFFNAGFRSRTTAWRNFKDVMGVTPSEFRQSLG